MPRRGARPAAVVSRASTVTAHGGGRCTGGASSWRGTAGPRGVRRAVPGRRAHRRWGAATWLPLSTQIERRHAVAAAQQSSHDHAGPVEQDAGVEALFEPAPVARCAPRHLGGRVTAFVCGLGAAAGSPVHPHLRAGPSPRPRRHRRRGRRDERDEPAAHHRSRAGPDRGPLGLVGLVLVSLRYAQVHGSLRRRRPARRR